MFKSIKSKLTILLSVLLLFSVLSSLVVTNRIVESSLRDSVTDAIGRTEQVVQSLLEAQTFNLLNQSQLVGVLPILATVVENGDPATILDSSKSYQEQLALPIFDVLDSDAEVLVSVQGNAEEEGNNQSIYLTDQALEEGKVESSLTVRQEQLAVVATAPIGLPDDPSGVLLVGSFLDHTFAQKIKALTNADISFMVDQSITGSSLTPGQHSELLRLLIPQSKDPQVSNEKILLERETHLLLVDPLKDIHGDVIGKVVIQFSLAEANAVLDNIRMLLISLGLGIFVVAILIGLFFTIHTIARPIQALEESARQLASGNLDYPIDARRSDELGNLAKSFMGMRDSIREKLGLIEEQNQNLERKVEDRTAAIKDLMDNTGQGFFTFDNGFHVHPEYSKPCQVFFEGSIEGLDAMKLMFAFPPFTAETLRKDIWQNDDASIFQRSDSARELFNMIFDGSGSFEVFEDLLPHEIEARGQILSLDYRLLNPESAKSKIMVILTDITTERALAAQIAEEEERNAMIIKVALDREGFIQFLKELHNIFLSLYTLLAQPSPDIDTNELFRYYHTIKGGCATYNFKKVVEHTHRIEAGLEPIRSGEEVLDEAKILVLLEDTKDLHEIYHDTLNDLSSIVPENDRMLTERVYRIKDSKIAQLKSFLWNKVVKESLKVLGNEIEELTQHPIGLIRETLMEKVSLEYQQEFEDSIEELRKQPIASIFHKYEASAEGLAERLEKQLQVVLKGTDVEVDYEYLESFFGALIHLIRNCVDHGFEDNATRIMLGKPEMGTLTIEASGDDQILKLFISDDGSGIDASVIKDIALDKGLIDDTFAKTATEEELVKLIFAPGFSTKETVSDVSGRGVGMDAVKAIVDELHGWIHIQTQMDRGTTFEIGIPLHLEDKSWEKQEALLEKIQEELKQLVQLKELHHAVDQMENQKASSIQFLRSAIEKKQALLCEELFSLLPILGNSPNAEVLAHSLAILTPQAVDHNLGRAQHEHNAAMRWIDVLPIPIVRILQEKLPKWSPSKTAFLSSITLEKIIQNTPSQKTVLKSFVHGKNPILQGATLFVLAKLDRTQALKEATQLMETEDVHWLVSDIALALMGRPQTPKRLVHKEGYGVEQSTIFQRLLWLNGSQFFNHLPVETLSTLARDSEVRSYIKNRPICHQGDPSHELLLLCTGTAEVRVRFHEKEETILTFSAGQTLGELGVLLRTPRSAKVVAGHPPTRVIAIKSAQFEKFLSQDAEITMSFLKVISERLHQNIEVKTVDA